ncbi:NAD(P)H-dependent oxidoreductase [Ruegeria meonggei]|uniref:Modulator of drug activity B n=1 Tax=Ruegeria meonggei TaxID=1446476 RepID=A0A1X6YLQ9_9RHOB|nr:NAD(P)H-dependent oxidoreductase [Ruegeria meonggei]SLN24974.1 Modulator of drug activity B [Ruegeria meonggei]
MSNILILNGTQPYEGAPGKLNASLTEQARSILTDLGHEVRITTVADGYDPKTEVDAHLWADTILMQFPVNWMGVPWPFKKYMDEVYTSAMDGRFADGDGRTSDAPKQNYGMGGKLNTKKYMLSVTFNAPKEAFDNKAEPFFAGSSVDDLMRPLHLTAKFIGLQPLPTFTVFDVMKNPTIETDFNRFEAHLKNAFTEVETVAA